MQYELRGFKELKAAITRNPRAVAAETKDFFTRALAAYSRSIGRNPWRLGRSGGGAPVASGQLRDTHAREIRPWEARIYPTAPYAAYVHGIDGWPRKRSYQLRPWLTHAYNNTDITPLEDRMMEAIVGDLAR